MKKIYLFCSAGMSTSMLASKMQDMADVHHLSFEVKAFPMGSMAETINEFHPDCILLGPQVKFALNDAKKKFGGESGVPVDVIDPSDYGLMNSEKVLKAAIKLMKK